MQKYSLAVRAIARSFKCHPKMQNENKNLQDWFGTRIYQGKCILHGIPDYMSHRHLIVYAAASSTGCWWRRIVVCRSCQDLIPSGRFRNGINLSRIIRLVGVYLRGWWDLGVVLLGEGCARVDWIFDVYVHTISCHHFPIHRCFISADDVDWWDLVLTDSEIMVLTSDFSNVVFILGMLACITQLWNLFIFLSFKSSYFFHLFIKIYFEKTF